MPEVSSGYFPDVNVQWNYALNRQYRTLITTGRTGIEKRRRVFPRGSDYGTGHKGGYLTMSASSSNLNAAEREAVGKFLDDMDGAFRAFYVFRSDRDNFSNYYVGDVTAQSSIIIPFKESTITSVTVSNSARAFTVTYGVGDGGEDRVNFNAGAQTGAVRVTLRAQQRVLVRAASDNVAEKFIAEMTRDNAVIELAFKQVR
jgi:hypothetical protein